MEESRPDNSRTIDILNQVWDMCCDSQPNIITGELSSLAASENDKLIGVELRELQQKWTKLYTESDYIINDHISLAKFQFLCEYPYTTKLLNSHTIPKFKAKTSSLNDQIIRLIIKNEYPLEIQDLIKEAYKLVYKDIATKQKEPQEPGSSKNVNPPKTMVDYEEDIKDVTPQEKTHKILSSSTKFPFLMTQIPNHLFGKYFDRSLVDCIILSKLTGKEAEKVSRMNYAEAWTYCDGKILIPHFDELRSAYSERSGPSQVVKELKDLIEETRPQRPPEGDQMVESIRTLIKNVKEIQVQLISSGRSAPVIAAAAPVFIPQAQPQIVTAHDPYLPPGFTRQPLV